MLLWWYSLPTRRVTPLSAPFSPVASPSNAPVLWWYSPMPTSPMAMKYGHYPMLNPYLLSPPLRSPKLKNLHPISAILKPWLVTGQYPVKRVTSM